MSTRRPTRTIGYSLAAAAVAAVGTYGIAGAVTPDPTPPPPGVSESDHTGSPGVYAAQQRAASPAAAPSDATRQVMNGLKNTDLTGLTTTAMPSGTSVTVQLAGNNDQLTDEWLADLAVGAYAELAHSDQTVTSDLVAKSTMIRPGPDGTPVTTDLGTGAVRLGQEFGSPSDSTLRGRAADVAKSFGLQVADVQILHPFESALEVKLVVPDGAKIGWTIDQLREALDGGQTPDVEGVLIELYAPDGQKLLQTSAAYRTGDGSLWFAPGQDERFGAMHMQLGAAPQ